MLIIRRDQMRLIGEARFHDELTALLTEESPEISNVPPEQWREALHNLTAKACSYGLETEQEVAAYIISAWLLGDNFDVIYPAASEVLTSNKITGDEKADWLEEWTEAIFAALEGE